MAGTFIPNRLADGQLPSSVGALYTVPGVTKSYVKFFNLHNRGPGTQIIIVYVNTRIWRRIELLVNESYNMLEEDRSLELSPGDAVRGETTNANTVDYVITGVEET